MILYEIAEKTKKRIKAMKKRTDPDELAQRAAALSPDTGFPFEKALSGPELSFICEVKKASPSKGIIDEEFDYLSIARQYERSGASAVSVLTEPDFFLGSFGYLREIADEVKLPVLCKDFIIDACQIYEAKLSGASAVLLICALHDTRTLSGFISLAHSLGLSSLVEAHDEKDIRSAVDAGARIIGVNNRDLKTFTVDLSLSVRLRKHVPGHILFVSESGIKTPADISVMQDIGANAVLIGETLMSSKNIGRSLEMLMSGLIPWEG